MQPAPSFLSIYFISFFISFSSLLCLFHFFLLSFSFSLSLSSSVSIFPSHSFIFLEFFFFRSILNIFLHFVCPFWVILFYFAVYCHTLLVYMYTRFLNVYCSMFNVHCSGISICIEIHPFSTFIEKGTVLQCNTVPLSIHRMQ